MEAEGSSTRSSTLLPSQEKNGYSGAAPTAKQYVGCFLCWRLPL